jgi:hypothetical protein
MSVVLPPPVGQDWQNWARQLSAFLGRKLSQLTYKSSGSSAAEDGVILWDAINGYPVVSKSGVWRQVILEDGHFDGAVTTQQTAAAANTAYALSYTPSISEGIATGTPASRIVFDEAGHYMVSFSAQITSATGSSITFYFWPRINGVDLVGSTMVNTLKNNGASLVVSRASAFAVNAGDYLEAMWAASSTAGSLTADAATAFCPAAPASTISITRLHA